MNKQKGYIALFSTIILSAVFQIVFSFFYSSEIITYNNQLDQYQTEVSQLKLDLESIEKSMADISSIKNISQSTSSASIQNITKTIKIIDP